MGEAHFDVPSPPRDADGDWIGTHWHDIVGTWYHGSTAVPLPDTVIVRHAGEPVATADAFHAGLLRPDGDDYDYYLILQVRTILDREAWQRLPWAQLGPGDVVFAWDKYFDIAYSRDSGSTTEMTYGGDWDDLQSITVHKGES